MGWIKKYKLLLLLLLVPWFVLLAKAPLTKFIPQTYGTEFQSPLGDTLQKDTRFTIRNIIITGNRKTKPQIILRELIFKSGDNYNLQDLLRRFEEGRRQLLNTSLFHEVIIAVISFDGNNVDVSIDVRERWYLFPIPYFKLIDRNFNEWINQHNASLKRVNYGFKLAYYNSTGRDDELRAALTSGYTKQVLLNYDRPFFDEKMKWGINLGVALGKNREVNYNTINNKLVSVDSAIYLHSFFRGKIEFTYRPAIKTRHRFGFAYTDEKVDDTVIALNPFYFKDHRNQVHFPEIYYQMTYFDVDYIPYPLQGYVAELSISKKGFNKTINEWQIIAKGSGTWPIAGKTYLNLRAVGSIKAPFKQPFYNQRFLGYADMGMQGYEMYVIDGVAGGYVKTVLSREVFDFNINIPSKKYKTLNHIPFRIFAKVYGNAGYVHNPQGGNNFLANKMLYSGGVGLDLLTFYDFVLKVEWSFNPLNQNGLYLHRKNYF